MQALNVGVIGCGGFARGIHIPNMINNPKFNLYAVADINETAARDTANDAHIERWTTNPDQLLSDKAVDAVLIATRHDFHAELSVKSAEAGKHVICEKPMGMNRDECKAVAEAVKRKNVKYTVGYNRGMAPLVVRARELLESTHGKKLIYHRIQAPFPEDDWTHNPLIGGGRFIGEGCHIFDLLCELAQAPPVSVYASGGTFLNPENVKIPDSGIVTIGFADGSVGTTLIASAGCAEFPKEATEIYCNNKAIYIDNFIKLSYFGFEKEPGNVELSAVDKGLAVELDKFADAVLNDTESPNGPVKAARAAVISYAVNESIASGKPIPVCEADYTF